MKTLIQNIKTNSISIATQVVLVSYLIWLLTLAL